MWDENQVTWTCRVFDTPSQSVSDAKVRAQIIEAND